MMCYNFQSKVLNFTNKNKKSQIKPKKNDIENKDIDFKMFHLRMQIIMYKLMKNKIK